MGSCTGTQFSLISLSVASPDEHERTPTTRKYTTNAQINTPRVRFARFARLSHVATGSIFRDFKCVFTQKFTRLEGKTKGANLRVEMHFRKSRRTSTYRFHRARSSLLKSHSVRRFAQVDGVFSRDDVVGTHYVYAFNELWFCLKVEISLAFLYRRSSTSVLGCRVYLGCLSNFTLRLSIRYTHRLNRRRRRYC